LSKLALRGFVLGLQRLELLLEGGRLLLERCSVLGLLVLQPGNLRLALLEAVAERTGLVDRLSVEHAQTLGVLESSDHVVEGLAREHQLEVVDVALAVHLHEVRGETARGLRELGLGLFQLPGRLGKLVVRLLELPVGFRVGVTRTLGFAVDGGQLLAKLVGLGLRCESWGCSEQRGRKRCRCCKSGDERAERAGASGILTGRSRVKGPHRGLLPNPMPSPR